MRTRTCIQKLAPRKNNPTISHLTRLRGLASLLRFVHLHASRHCPGSPGVRRMTWVSSEMNGRFDLSYRANFPVTNLRGAVLRALRASQAGLICHDRSRKNWATVFRSMLRFDSVCLGDGPEREDGVQAQAAAASFVNACIWREERIDVILIVVEHDVRLPDAAVDFIQMPTSCRFFSRHFADIGDKGGKEIGYCQNAFAGANLFANGVFDDVEADHAVRIAANPPQILRRYRPLPKRDCRDAHERQTIASSPTARNHRRGCKKPRINDAFPPLAYVRHASAGQDIDEATNWAKRHLSRRRSYSANTALAQVTWNHTSATLNSTKSLRTTPPPTSHPTKSLRTTSPLTSHPTKSFRATRPPTSHPTKSLRITSAPAPLPKKSLGAMLPQHRSQMSRFEQHHRRRRARMRRFFSVVAVARICPGGYSVYYGLTHTPA